MCRTNIYYSEQHHRLQNFIDSAYILAEKTQEKIELLIIEWNPPPDKRRVIDAFVRFEKKKKYHTNDINRDLELLII